jgi:flagellar basal-body rod protein FlgF
MDTIGMIEAGMLNDVQRLQMIGHNLANITTVGFKKQVAVTHAFNDHLQAAVVGNGVSTRAAPRPMVTTITDQSSGALKHSGNPMDVAIEGDGYFSVSLPSGEALSRQGNLQLDSDGRLVTAGGNPVLGMSGEIRVSGSAPTIDQDGNVYDGNRLVDRIRVVQVSDATTLTRAGDGMFLADSDAGLMEGTGYRVRQGYTEAANVTSMYEMISMIETMRHFEAGQKLAHGLDDMLDRSINQLGQL